MPTSSQLTNTWKRLSARTRLSIEKQNSDRNMKNRPKRPRRVQMAVASVWTSWSSTVCCSSSAM